MALIAANPRGIESPAALPPFGLLSKGRLQVIPFYQVHPNPSRKGLLARRKMRLIHTYARLTALQDE